MISPVFERQRQQYLSNNNRYNEVISKSDISKEIKRRRNFRNVKKQGFNALKSCLVKIYPLIY